MKPEDLEEDMKKVVGDVEKEGEKAIDSIEDSIEEAKKSPFWWIAGLFLALIIILMVIPYSGIKLDPYPKNIPTISEAVEGVELGVVGVDYDDRGVVEMNQLVDPTDSAVKMVADRVSSLSCDKSGVICHSKAIFLFVRDNFDYVSDPSRYEYVKSAKESLVSLGGDCDDASVLLSNMLEAIGVDTRFVFIPGHVYVEAKVPGVAAKHENEYGFVVLDATCSYCEFGEMPYKNVDKEKRYMEV